MNSVREIWRDEARRYVYKMARRRALENKALALFWAGMALIGIAFSLTILYI